jgi:hypothetical protein
MWLIAPAVFAATVERSVTPGAAGPNRLDVDVALLSRAASDLRDLRFTDARGVEVGYLLVDEAPAEPRWIQGRMLPIAQTKTSSGFELDLGATTSVDRLRVDGIAAPFLKRIRVEGSGDRARWTVLADATVFDLPDERLELLEVPFAPNTFRYLRATWDDRSSARVQPIGASAREHRMTAKPEPLRGFAPFRKRAGEPGKSRYRIDLPGPHLPLTAIELRVANGNVYRTATITEPRFGNGEVQPVTLGTGTLRRAERGGAVAEEMAIRITRPTGSELDLAIDDANNPPLALTHVITVFEPQPWIYFEAPSAETLIAHFGDERLQAPRYDLEASRPQLATMKFARAAWGNIAAPQTTTAPPSTDTIATLRGAEVGDREAWLVARPVPVAPRGLAVLLLDAHVLARSSELRDVRIIDAQKRQVPYIVEKRAEPLVVRVTPVRVESAPRMSVYRIAPPYSALPRGTKLVLKTSARVFERNVTLRRAADDRRSRASSQIETKTWRASDPELLPPALTFDDVPAEALELAIEEGDNEPLPIASAELLLPAAALRFHHPGTPLFLLYGNREAHAPQYDLALLAPRLFGETARELTLSPASGAPQAKAEDDRERKFFWIAIAVTAVLLLALLARLLRA